jgi:hypothetical protein
VTHLERLARFKAGLAPYDGKTLEWPAEEPIALLPRVSRARPRISLSCEREAVPDIVRLITQAQAKGLRLTPPLARLAQTFRRLEKQCKTA